MVAPIQKLLTIVIGALLTTGMAVQGVPLYNDSSVDTGNSLNLVNGQMIGNEINLASGITSANVTSFTYEIFSPDNAFAGPNVQMEAFLYANDGTPVNGFSTPSKVLYDSGSFHLSTPLQDPSGMEVATLTFDLSAKPIPVGNDLTLAVVVTGLASTDSVGMELFDPAAVGQNFGDFWANSGSGWELLAIPGERTDFGAVIEGTVPDTVSTAMLLGAGLSGLSLARRKLKAC
jgi:hypothetical protein